MHALGGDFPFLPSEDGRFVHAEHRAQLFKRGFGAVPIFAKCAHASAYSCVTYNVLSSLLLHDALTTVARDADSFSAMARPTKIHKGKQPHRFHYIPEWAEHRGVSQADIMRGVGADKGTVSRWFDGTIPVEKHLIALVGFLETEEVAALFRHPDDDWMMKLFRNRLNPGQKVVARKQLEALAEQQAA